MGVYLRHYSQLGGRHLLPGRTPRPGINQVPGPVPVEGAHAVLRAQAGGWGRGKPVKPHSAKCLPDPATSIY